MLALGIALSDSFCERWKWFIGFGLKRIANLFASLRSSRRSVGEGEPSLAGESPRGVSFPDRYRDHLHS